MSHSHPQSSTTAIKSVSVVQGFDARTGYSFCFAFLYQLHILHNLLQLYRADLFKKFLNRQTFRTYQVSFLRRSPKNAFIFLQPVQRLFQRVACPQCQATPHTTLTIYNTLSISILSACYTSRFSCLNYLHICSSGKLRFHVPLLVLPTSLQYFEREILHVVLTGVICYKVVWFLNLLYRAKEKAGYMGSSCKDVQLNISASLGRGKGYILLNSDPSTVKSKLSL